MWGKVAALAVAIALLPGCGSNSDTATKTTTTTTTVAPAEAMAAWRADVVPIVDDLQAAMRWVSGAAKSLDLSDTRAGCREIRDVAGRLSEQLPSPDAQVTKSIENAIENYNDLAMTCQGLNPSTSKAEFRQLSNYIDTGTEHMNAAIDRMNAIRDGSS